MNERAARKRERELAATSQGVGDRYTLNGKLRKKYTKKVANTTPINTASDAVYASGRSIKGSSKKINYDALKVFIHKLFISITIYFVYY